MGPCRRPPGPPPELPYTEVLYDILEVIAMLGGPIATHFIMHYMDCYVAFEGDLWTKLEGCIYPIKNRTILLYPKVGMFKELPYRDEVRLITCDNGYFYGGSMRDGENIDRRERTLWELPYTMFVSFDEPPEDQNLVLGIAGVEIPISPEDLHAFAKIMRRWQRAGTRHHAAVAFWLDNFDHIGEVL